MSVSYAGFNMNALTFRCSSEISKGMPVKIHESDSVMLCADGDDFHGVVINGDEKYASVQVKGIVTLPYTGTAPVTGFNGLGANGNGGVKVTENGGRYLVVSIDETAKTVTFLM